MQAPLPPRESERLAALQAFKVLDSEREEAFDELVYIASQVCNTRVALVSFVDKERQWFKASIGLDVKETHRDLAFCAHAILGDGPMIVGDATHDARFHDNPLVLEDPQIRFYAGAPLRTNDGHALGTLCVIDPEPRDKNPLDEKQIGVLEALSRQAVRLLRNRKVSAQLADSLERVKLLAPLVPICAWCRRIRDDKEYWSSIEDYLEANAAVCTTHGICPDCFAKADQ